MSWTNAHLFQWATWRQTLLKFQSNFIFFFHENAFENICKCHHFNSGLQVLMFVQNLENSRSKKRTKLLILRFLAIKGPVFYTVQCRHNSVQYIMVLLHTTIQWQEQNINQIMKSQMTPHTSPLWASYGVSFMRILKKIDHVIMAPHCTVCGGAEVSANGKKFC